MSNVLFGVYEKTTPDKMILVRIFGTNTDTLIDRKFELDAVMTLSKFGFAEPFLVQFRNGVTARFIDFEYAGFAPIASEIGNHFSEFVGPERGNPTLFPNQEFRRKWILSYLKSLALTKNAELIRRCSVLSLDDWLHETILYSMLADLLWATWSYVQADISDLSCDFTG
ncbi:hypothetical protein Ciccas_002870 [Cichlidogyrus casuarinus]|uniref:ethanolamine kinase n=1 Tax=Cichlidogyrus casuarinus TaxID=1844966 RepID=A0ABD2QG11_9PLAT